MPTPRRFFYQLFYSSQFGTLRVIVQLVTLGLLLGFGTFIYQQENSGLDRHLVLKQIEEGNEQSLVSIDNEESLQDAILKDLDAAIPNQLKKAVRELLGADTPAQRPLGANWFERPALSDDLIVVEDRRRRDVSGNETWDIGLVMSDEYRNADIGLREREDPVPDIAVTERADSVPHGLKFLRHNKESRRERARTLVEEITRLMLDSKPREEIKVVDVDEKAQLYRPWKADDSHHTGHPVLGHWMIEKLNAQVKHIQQVLLSDHSSLPGETPVARSTVA